MSASLRDPHTHWSTYSVPLAAKYQINYHDVRTLHYLSQGVEPSESVPQLQSHFEAWKVSPQHTEKNDVSNGVIMNTW